MSGCDRDRDLLICQGDDEQIIRIGKNLSVNVTQKEISVIAQVGRKCRKSAHFYSTSLMDIITVNSMGQFEVNQY